VLRYLCHVGNLKRVHARSGGSVISCAHASGGPSAIAGCSRLVARVADTRGRARGRSPIWRSVRRDTGAAHRLPSDLDLFSDMRAESISVARQDVGGASLAIFQCVIAAGGGAAQASPNRVASSISAHLRAALIAGAAARRRAGLSARARGCTALSVRAGCALTIGALVCIRIGLIGR
jgi:hypothetical protein